LNLIRVSYFTTDKQVIGVLLVNFCTLLPLGAFGASELTSDPSFNSCRIKRRFQHGKANDFILVKNVFRRNPVFWTAIRRTTNQKWWSVWRYSICMSTGEWSAGCGEWWCSSLLFWCVKSTACSGIQTIL